MLQVGINVSVGMNTCVIDCSHGYALAADPVNCKNYYICYDDYHSEFPFACDGNKYFDMNSHTCRDSSYHCTSECEKCSFECSAPVLGKRASLFDCGVYYDCKNEKWHSCPDDNPYYDGNVCQKDNHNCCTCRPQCTAVDAGDHAMVQDYRNCSNFYLCMVPGIPDESTHGHCPIGFFDPEAKTCKEDIPCIQPCGVPAGF